MQIEFLDVLYTWKVEAEQEYEKIVEDGKLPVHEREAKCEFNLHNLRLKNAETKINMLRNTITTYLHYHK